MAERKAVNKWYPPDFDPKKHGSANGYQGSHHLRERARKLDQGILIVRFEMPFNIWCDGCKNHIGMGVRYNAEKSKLGSYYTSTIYQFRMKCHLCDNHFEIKTDPANLDYVVVSGARRQDKRWDPTDNEQVVGDEKDKIKRMATDSMFKLEHIAEDKGKLQRLVPTLERLEVFQDHRWKDDYSANAALRSSFRSVKKQRLAEEKRDEQIASKCAIPIQLVQESEEDKRLAHLLTFQSAKSPEEQIQAKRKDLDFAQLGLPNSTINQFVKEQVKNPRLKSMAKDFALRQSNSIDRKSIKAELNIGIRKVNEFTSNSSSTSTGGDDKNGKRPLVADYGSGSESE